MTHPFTRSIFPLILVLTAGFLDSCGSEQPPQTVPQALQGAVFVYDWLKTGEGSGATGVILRIILRNAGSNSNGFAG